jgi:hypothetical protein
LAKASACLRADDGDASGQCSPIKASFMCLLLSPYRLIFLGHLGCLAPTVNPDSRVSSLRRRRVWWWCSWSPLRGLSATCGSMVSPISLRWWDGRMVSSSPGISGCRYFTS